MNLIEELKKMNEMGNIVHAEKLTTRPNELALGCVELLSRAPSEIVRSSIKQDYTTMLSIIAGLETAVAGLYLAFGMADAREPALRAILKANAAAIKKETGFTKVLNDELQVIIDDLRK